MIRTNRLLTSLLLVFALLAQPLAALAQNKTLKSGAANSSAAQNGASVDILKVRPVGGDVVDVTWDVVIPAGVEVLGFDVRVDANLSNGTAQTDSKSFGGNARSGSFKFNLPLASNGGGGPKPGGGNGGVIGPATSRNIAASDIKAVETRSSDKAPRKFGEGNISGGGNTGGNNNPGNGGGAIGIRPVRPTPTPTPIFPRPVRPTPTPTPRPVVPPIVIPTPKPLPKPEPKPEPVRITKLQAFITAKFAAGNDLAAFSEFIQPTDATTGEMKLKGARGNALQAKKLIHLNPVARLVAECPAGQECFDIIAELRGAEANGQFKVSAEVIFANGVRKNTSRVVGNLFRPVRLSVDKVPGQQISNVLVNINGGGNREQFTKTDTQGLAILQGIGDSKK